MLSISLHALCGNHENGTNSNLLYHYIITAILLGGLLYHLVDEETEIHSL